ncbi:hypothetical protein DFH27DRAFT_600182 [Peziza echinospora]|nr:hypothetical protein DFH27DRAFT_600182 [Peziza echinospora]
MSSENFTQKRRRDHNLPGVSSASGQSSAQQMDRNLPGDKAASDQPSFAATIPEATGDLEPPLPLALALQCQALAPPTPSLIVPTWYLRGLESIGDDAEGHAKLISHLSRRNNELERENEELKARCGRLERKVEELRTEVVILRGTVKEMDGIEREKMEEVEEERRRKKDLVNIVARGKHRRSSSASCASGDEAHLPSQSSDMA